jgi:hypothetical protein
VDETGGQIAVFGRLGSRPFTREEMEQLFMTRSGVPWRVSDEVNMDRWVGREIGPLRRNADMDARPEDTALGGD